MIKTLDTIDTIFPADSVEWCPIDGYQDIFVCGTYLLTQKESENEQESEITNTFPQERLGSIYLFQVIIDGKLKLHQPLGVPGVLDIKWAHVRCQENILLGVVNSEGFLQLFKLCTGDDLNIELLTEIKIREVEDEILALSLDWNTGRSPKEGVDEAKISVSDSKGHVSIFNLHQGQLNCIATNKAHNFEAWITAFDYWNTNITYTGGDDCAFKRFDIREGIKLMNTSTVHQAGVTSIHFNSSEEFSFASGSYDEVLRLWDTRNTHQPLSETPLGGGIWRLKWNPCVGLQKYLLAACMHDGFRLIECTHQEKPVVVEEYNEHNSISYGCDWSFLSGNEITNKLHLDLCQKTTLIATCSFYDHILKISAINWEERL